MSGQTFEAWPLTGQNFFTHEQVFVAAGIIHAKVFRAHRKFYLYAQHLWLCLRFRLGATVSQMFYSGDLPFLRFTPPFPHLNFIEKWTAHICVGIGMLFAKVLKFPTLE